MTEYRREPTIEEDIREDISERALFQNRAFSWLFNAVIKATRPMPDSERYAATMDGLEIVDLISYSNNDRNWKHNEELNFKVWYHVGRPQLIGKKRCEPYILVAETQEAAARYLDLSYRVDELDRILVDMLVAAELFAFADEIQPILKQRVPILLKWLLNNVASVLGAALISGGLLWLWPNSTVAGWAAAIIFGIVILMTAWSLVAFPFFYPDVRKRLGKVRSTIDAMLDAYAALSGEPASTKHIRQRLQRATDAGAVWPAQLFVLMDDIESRRTSF